MMWFKVLVNGKSCHGGDMQWSLPTQSESGEWIPGEWHEVGGRLQMCGHPGIHLTNEPARWCVEGGEFFVAEYDGEFVVDESDKIACRKVRLIRVASADEMAAVRVYTCGEHEISDGVNAVLGNAVIKRATGNAVIERADGNAVIKWADGNAVIKWATGNAVIKWADGNAVITSSYIVPGKVVGYAVLIDRSKLPPTVICGWDVKPDSVTA